MQVEIFPWNINFECGIALIDEQHRRLVDLLNTLVSHLAYQSDAPELNAVFDQLSEYAVKHFRDEEEIWAHYLHADAWTEWHHDAHGDFAAQVAALHAQDKPLDEVIESIVAFLTHWLALHIIESDKRMAKVVHALSSGMSLEQAKELANHEMAGATRVLIDTVMSMYDSLANRTVLLTREIAKRAQAEKALLQAQADLISARDEAVAAEARMREDFTKILVQQNEQNQKMTVAMERTVVALSSTLEARDPYTAGHQRDVARIAELIASEMGLDPFRIQGIKLAAQVHDIGKIQVPMQILCKPSRLSKLEMDLIRLHPQAGYNILKDLDLPWPIADMVLQHHEYLDGSGYPQGLKGEEICLEAQILTVADIVESMSSARPYRPALGLPAALVEIQRLKGSALNPVIVDACLSRAMEGRLDSNER